jgi:hypothetical protein
MQIINAIFKELHVFLSLCYFNWVVLQNKFNSHDGNISVLIK